MRKSKPAPVPVPDLAERTLVMTRVFDAPRRLVFDAWTRPEHAAKWWAPQGLVTVSCDMDARPGGRWSMRVRTPEGNVIRKQGIYREIVAPERLVFTYAWDKDDGTPGVETLVTVTFTENGGRTRIALHQAVFETAASCASHRGGWTSTFERFAQYLANKQE